MYVIIICVSLSIYVNTYHVIFIQCKFANFVLEFIIVTKYFLFTLYIIFTYTPFGNPLIVEVANVLKVLSVAVLVCSGSNSFIVLEKKYFVV